MKKVFSKNTKYLSRTSVNTDGKVIITPDSAVMPQILPSGVTSLSQNGDLVTFDDGEMIFEPKAAHEQGPSRYTTLFGTPHAEVKEYAKSLIVSFKFDRTRLKGIDMSQLMCEESDALYKMLRKYKTH